MSLVTGVVHNDYVFLTGDRKSVAVTYNFYDDGSVDEVCSESSGDGPPKVEQLTVKVLIGAVGSTVLTDRIIAFIKQEVDQTGDLAECAKAFKQILNEIKAEDTDESRWLFSSEGTYTGIYMVGFYKGGTPGLISYQSYDGAEIIEQPQGDADFLAFADGVGTEALEYPFALARNEEAGILKFTQRANDLHRIISYANPQLVSENYDMLTLTREGSATCMTFSTAPRHNELVGKDVSAFISSANDTLID